MTLLTLDPKCMRYCPPATVQVVSVTGLDVVWVLGRGWDHLEVWGRSGAAGGALGPVESGG